MSYTGLRPSIRKTGHVTFMFLYWFTSKY